MHIMDKLKEKKFNINFLKYIRNFDYFFYRRKHLILYILIGITSIFVELLLRNIFLSINLSTNISSISSLLIGILFAFILNFFFNFNVPNFFFYRSMTYFFVISLTSYFSHILIQTFINIENYSYENTRYFFSGTFFLIGYFFHINFTFKDKRIVGVAIYANNENNIGEIFNKIGLYPDFIHIDIIDKTFKKDSDDIDLNKISIIRNFWPNHYIDLHIMSNKPTQYISNEYKNLNVIYFHYEINEDIDKVITAIYKINASPGIVLHAKYGYPNLKDIINKFNNILILSIENPGSSGQIFMKQSYELVRRINIERNSKKIMLCVDGGVTIKNLNNFNCEKIVSATDILSSLNPKKKIMGLQTLSRYEKQSEDYK